MDSLRRKIGAAYASAALVLLVGAASLAGVGLWRRATAWVVHTQQVMEQTERLMSLLKDAETGQRGYLITGDTAYLRPFELTRARVGPQGERVRALVADNTDQAARVDSLRAVAAQKLAELDRTVRLRRYGGMDAAAAVVRGGTGLMLMDRARMLSQAVEAHERALLRGRVRSQQAAAWAVLLLIGVGSVSACVLSLLTTRGIRREVAEREEAREQLELQAAQLEEQATELEQQAEALMDQAARSNAVSVRLGDALASRNRFYAAMSHELRTPVNAIMGFNDLLLAGIYGELTEAQRTAVERSQRSTRHLTELVGDVLDLSRLEAGRAEVQAEEVDVASLVPDVLAGVRPLAQKRGTDLRFGGGDGCVVRTDPRRVRQILLNLLSNAIKFGEGRPVVVRCGPAQGGVELTVADEGRGIDPADAERIFDEFVQIDNPARSELTAQGTGLGLPISRRLAHLLGGTLSVDSRPGQGSTFTLWLPPRPPEDVDPTSPGPAA